MLHPETQAIANALTGYEPFDGEEGLEQYQAEINFNPKGVVLGKLETYPKNGSVYCVKGTLRLYWKPSGGNYNEQEKDELQGWYDIPCNEDIEEWTMDSVCLTPAYDEVEPDHPDSWLSLLGLI